MGRKRVMAAGIIAAAFVGFLQAQTWAASITVSGPLTSLLWGSSVDGLVLDSGTRATFTATYDDATPVQNPLSLTKVYLDNAGVSSLTLTTGSDSRTYNFTRLDMEVSDNVVGSDSLNFAAINLGSFATPSGGSAVGIYGSYDTGFFSGDLLDRMSKFTPGANNYIYIQNANVAATFNLDTVMFTGAAAVPLPSSAAMGVVCLAGVGLLARRQRAL